MAKHIIDLVNFIDGEIWKKSSLLGGDYYVSNKGRIKILNYHNRGIDRLARLFIDKRGYVSVKRLYHHFLVHRVVLNAFIGERDMPVNHIDGNKGNNLLENLEYVTSRENSTHGLKLSKGRAGYHYREERRAWIVTVSTNGVNLYLAQCKTEKHAHMRYILALYYFGIENKYA